MDIYLFFINSSILLSMQGIQFLFNCMDWSIFGEWSFV
ncbi:unnamed protein product [Schistosoma curassoni]|uniref:Uncharacterized protein n=1 Tax=Schistosoma curassoni TaxID=6186 RepID=A0A183L3R1_9TREM|nr:unnamed protein product [Schistosoma curassoni]